jgi:transposase
MISGSATSHAHPKKSDLFNKATWVSKYYPNERLKLPEKSADHLELLRLRKEITRLKQERDILKKAAAYFASDTQ